MSAFKRGDVTGALNALADNVDSFIPGPNDIIPFAGKRHGREQVARFFAKLRRCRTRNSLISENS